MRKFLVIIFVLAIIFVAGCSDSDKKELNNVTLEKDTILKNINLEEKAEAKSNLEEKNATEESISEEDDEKNNKYELQEELLETSNIKPSQIFACLGVDDNLITNYRAGLFVAGSLPLVDLYEPSITSKVEFTKNGEYFDTIFNYYNEDDKLIAQYECPKAIKGETFINYFDIDNDNDYRKECLIEKEGDKYISESDCKPHLYCIGPNVKLKIFEKFVNKNAQDNKVIKTFENKNDNSCQNARKLYEAAGKGNLQQVKDSLSKTDANIATSSVSEPYFQWEDGMVLALDRPLLNAIKNNQTEIAKLLLEKGANPNLPNLESMAWPFVGEETFDALGWAIKKNNYKIKDLILPKMESKKESLVAAACYGDNKTVIEILKEDTSTINKPGFIDDTVYTPLSCALSHFNIEVAETLITYGANVNQPDPSGQDPMYCTPLQLAVYTNDLKTVKFLIDNGADVNLIVRTIDGRFVGGYCKSALEIAERHQNKEMEKLLLDAGATFEGKIVKIDVSETKDDYEAIIEFLKSYKVKKP